MRSMLGFGTGDLGAGRLDGGAGSVHLCLGGGHARLGAALAGAVVVQLLLGGCAVAGQLGGAGQAALGGIQLALAQGHLRLGGPQVALAQRHLGVGGGHAVLRLGVAGHGFAALGLQGGHVHAGQGCTGLDEVAFGG